MNTENIERLEDRMNVFRTRFKGLIDEIQRAMVGYDDIIADCLKALFSQGHVLLEGVPGLGKTYLVRVISKVLGLTFGRIQCTPDLMPADILGTHIVSEDAKGRRTFQFEKGPVFKHLLLVDEINRATPKTQAALLEVMQERCVTAGGERMVLPTPFFVLATQNPIEMEGTYPLPEAQLDRFFFKLRVPFPKGGDLVEISRRTTRFTEPDLDIVMHGPEILEFQELLTNVPVADPVTEYAAELVLATHADSDNAPDMARRYVAYGASPRGMQALIRGARVSCLLDGRTAVSLDDVKAVAKQALRHRVILNFEGEAESVNVDRLVDEILDKIPTPAKGIA
ncbi:MAG: MoxR family ATPase [Planctomycetes bacterium]|nr:MoxR family ATPase [Planctomycetota bacterium]